MWLEVDMTMTSADLPGDLLAEAKRATGQSTVRGTLIAALEDVVRRQRQVDAVTALSQLEFLDEWLQPEVSQGARR
jgi:hypothetical protein